MTLARFMRPCKPGCVQCKAFIARAKASEAKRTVDAAKGASGVLKAKRTELESVERLAHAVVKARNVSLDLQRKAAKPSTKPAKSTAATKFPFDMGKPPIHSWKSLKAEFAAARAENAKVAEELRAIGSVHAERCVREFLRLEQRFEGAHAAFNTTKAIRALSDARAHIKNHKRIATERSRAGW